MRSLASQSGLTLVLRSAILLKVAFLRQAVSLVLALSMLAANLAACAGWSSSPESRMACCEGMENCPMHGRKGTERSTQQLTQADADACCAMSESRDAAPGGQGPPITISMTVATAPLLPSDHAVVESAPVAIRPHPDVSPSVPKHLLLSVLLV